MRIVLACVAIALAGVAVYARTTGYGLFADDFSWLLGAQQFEAARLFDLSHRDHFYRPVVELYFPAAFTVCGRSASCYHWLSTFLHIGTSLLVTALAASISRSGMLGAFAGLLFAVQPGPVEAVIWVSAVSEVIVTGLFVLTVWLFWRAIDTGHLGSYALACVSFVACLLAHESGITLLPLLVLMLWCLPNNAQRTRIPVPLLLTPFVLATAAYGVVAYIVNSRNYVVTEGQYGFGAHLVSNVLGAVVTLAVGRRDLLSLVIVGGLSAWAALAAPPRMRLYALWLLVTLGPFAGFHGGLSSRYLYLPAVGFAGLTAEAIWWARHALARWPRAGVAVWWVVATAVTVRFAVFAVKNVEPWAHDGAAYQAYAASVRELYPSPPRGARLEVPPPPRSIAPHYVPALIRWELADPGLEVVVRARQ